MIINRKALQFGKQLQKLRDTHTLVLSAFFIALYVILYFCNIKLTNDIQIRPGYLAIAAAAMYGGPIMGCLTGAVGDVLSMIITGGQGEVFFFGFTASYALMGFLFGLVLYGGYITVLRCVCAAGIEFLVSILLNTYWLMIMYYNGQNYRSLMLLRLPKCLIMFVISCVLLSVTIKALYLAFKRARLLQEC